VTRQSSKILSPNLFIFLVLTKLKLEIPIQGVMRDSEETGVQFSREDFCQLSYSGLMGLKIGFFLHGPDLFFRVCQGPYGLPCRSANVRPALVPATSGACPGRARSWRMGVAPPTSVPALWHPDQGLNRINKILISTSCNFFPNSGLKRTSRLSVLGLEQFWDGWPIGKYFPSAHEWKCAE
jgi:hypothetical protein